MRRRGILARRTLRGKTRNFRPLAFLSGVTGCPEAAKTICALNEQYHRKPGAAFYRSLRAVKVLLAALRSTLTVLAPRSEVRIRSRWRSSCAFDGPRVSA